MPFWAQERPFCPRGPSLTDRIAFCQLVMSLVPYDARPPCPQLARHVPDWNDSPSVGYGCIRWARPMTSGQGGVVAFAHAQPRLGPLGDWTKDGDSLLHKLWGTHSARQGVLRKVRRPGRRLIARSRRHDRARRCANWRPGTAGRTKAWHGNHRCHRGGGPSRPCARVPDREAAKSKAGRKKAAEAKRKAEEAKAKAEEKAEEEAERKAEAAAQAQRDAEKSATDAQFKAQILPYYNRLSDYDSRIASCATTFNTIYLSTDFNKRYAAAQECYALEQSIQSDATSFSSIQVPEGSSYATQHAAVMRCLNDLVHIERVDDRPRLRGPRPVQGRDPEADCRRQGPQHGQGDRAAGLPGGLPDHQVLAIKS